MLNIYNLFGIEKVEKNKIIFQEEMLTRKEIIGITQIYHRMIYYLFKVLYIFFLSTNFLSIIFVMLFSKNNRLDITSFVFMFLSCISFFMFNSRLFRNKFLIWGFVTLGLSFLSYSFLWAFNIILLIPINFFAHRLFSRLQLSLTVDKSEDIMALYIKSILLLLIIGIIIYCFHC